MLYEALKNLLPLLHHTEIKLVFNMSLFGSNIFNQLDHFFWRHLAVLYMCSNVFKPGLKYQPRIA